MNTEDSAQLLRELFASQGLAVLSTNGQGQPYSSLVAFAATEDLRHLLFATTRSTRKFANLRGHPRVALLVDNRSNREADFREAVAVTATGLAREAVGDERDALLALYRSRHPCLEDFVAAPTSALVAVRVESYFVVRRFQNVEVVRMGT